MGSVRLTHFLEDTLFALAIVAGALAIVSLQRSAQTAAVAAGATLPVEPETGDPTRSGSRGEPPAACELPEPDAPPSRELELLAAVAAKPRSRRRRRAF